jgi:hypothetical protein
MASEFGKWTISDDELEAQFQTAKARAAEVDEFEPRAVAVRYDEVTERIEMELSNGCIFAFPVQLIKELNPASSEQRAAVYVSKLGNALFWDELDAHYSVPSLLAGFFGSKAWMRALGRRGGQRSSEAKSNAARLNGQKGGRPRRVPDVAAGPAGLRVNQRGMQVTPSDWVQSGSCGQMRARQMLASVMQSMASSLSADEILELVGEHFALQTMYAPDTRIQSVAMQAVRTRHVMTGTIVPILEATLSRESAEEALNAA